MKKSTIFFLQALYDNTSQQEAVLKLVQEQLELELCRYQNYYELSDAWEIGSTAKSCTGRIADWQRNVKNLQCPDNAVDLMEDLTEILNQIENLESITKNTIFFPGSLDMTKVHIVTDSLKKDFEMRLYIQVMIDYYLVLIYGTEKMFQCLPWLSQLETDIQEFIQIYQRKILPVVTSIPQDRREFAWAFCRAEDEDYADRFSYGFIPCKPQNTAGIIPGKLGNIILDKHPLIQGRGRITNVTPRNIRIAQAEGICRELPKVIDEDTFGTGNLKEILDVIFHGRYYVLDPEDLIIMLNKYLLRKKLRLRKRNGQCIFCGSKYISQNGVCILCQKAIEEGR